MTSENENFVPTQQVAVSQRSAARLAAVQALYQLELMGSDIKELIDEYVDHRLGQEMDGDLYAKADPGWFKLLVTGVKNEQKVIDPWIQNVLKQSWPLRRIDSTLRAILRAGTFELYKQHHVPPKTVISEYLSVTVAFFGQKEQQLVNGVLDQIARQCRPDELEPKSGKTTE